MKHQFVPNPGRRFFLKSAAASLTLTIAPHTGLAQASLVTRHKVGASDVISVNDGSMRLPVKFLLPETTQEEIEELFKVGRIELLPFASPVINVAFIRNDANLIAVDCGAGSNFMESAGKLPDGLTEAGINAVDVTHVIFTHAHPDHLWGAIDDFEDAVRFPNAKHMISTVDWDYWTNKELEGKTAEENKGMLAGTQRILGRLDPRLERVASNAQIVSGVSLLPTPGHTPGHCSVMIEDGNDRLLILGDTLSHPLISFQKPDWQYGPDIDRDTAITTRRSLLAMLAADKLPFCGYHLPKGGFGRVEFGGSSYQLRPI